MAAGRSGPGPALGAVHGPGPQSGPLSHGHRDGPLGGRVRLGALPWTLVTPSQ